MSAYAELAVDSLRDFYAANLQAQLTLVETAAGLSAGDLPPPSAYLDYPRPRDNRTLLQIYETGLTPRDQRNGTWFVECVVAFTYNSMGADLSDAYVKLRRYLTAILWTVLKNPTLGGAVIGCNLIRSDPIQEVGDKSMTRHHYVSHWNVLVSSEVTFT